MQLRVRAEDGLSAIQLDKRVILAHAALGTRVDADLADVLLEAFGGIRGNDLDFLAGVEHFTLLVVAAIC